MKKVKSCILLSLIIVFSVLLFPNSLLGANDIGYVKTLNVPGNFKATLDANAGEDSYHKIILSWDKVENAEDYYIWIDNSLYITENNNYSSVVYNSSKAHTFKVKAHLYNGQDIYSDAISISDFYIMDGVYIDKLELNKNHTKLNINWIGEKASDGYEIYLKDSENSIWKSYKTTKTSMSFDVVGVKNYSVKIRSYKKQEDKVIYAPFSDEKSVNVLSTYDKPDRVVNLNLGLNYRTSEPSGGVVISKWTDVKWADGYQIAVKKEGNDKYSNWLYKNSNSPTYSYDAPWVGKKYYFKVRAYKKIMGRIIYGEYSDTKFIYPIGQPQHIYAELLRAKRVNITWDKMDGCDGYIVMYRENGGERKVFGYTKSTSYEKTMNKYGTKYQFSVKTYKDIQGIRVISDIEDEYPIYTLGVPDVELNKKTSSKVVIKTKSVKGASGYKIYAKKPGSKKYKLVVTTTAKKYTHTKLKKGKYTYKVKAYKEYRKYNKKTKKTKKRIVYSKYSKTKTIKLK